MSGAFGARRRGRIAERQTAVLAALIAAGGEASTREVARAARVAVIEAARDLHRLEESGLVASRLRSPRVRLWRATRETEVG